MQLAKHKSTKDQPHKIGLYIRVSTEEQAENPDGSIRNQEERLRATVNYKNMSAHFGEVAEVFIDRARSGKDTNRPELQRLLSAIRKREITLVMVSELSRLSRNMRDFAQIWEMMLAHGCGFLSLRETFDTTSAAGEMMLYSIANFAQFERRQTSERISANLQARAARGLYNGGIVPLGYKLIADKPGFLAINPEMAEVVRAAFKAFLKEGTLTSAGKWLNSNGYKISREVQGGNHRPRLGHFTVENLHNILRNKSYIGIRIYQQRGEKKETKANWEPIIDERVFEQVQAKLKANHCSKKPAGGSRWPFLLTSLVNCENCAERMVGKSAHGNGGKIPYYEHGWATRRQSCLVKPMFNCKPFRVLAKKLEPAVWDAVEQLLKNEWLAEDLIESAQKLHKEKSKNKEFKRIQEKIKSLDGQMEVLASRLAELPKSVSPAPVFKQMEKLEALKLEEEGRLSKEELNKITQDVPANLKKYQDFLRGLNTLARGDNTEATREKIIRVLVRKIWITENGFKLEFHTGGDYMEWEQRQLEEEPVLPDSWHSDDDFDFGHKKTQGGFLISLGSNSLTNGGHVCAPIFFNTLPSKPRMAKREFF